MTKDFCLARKHAEVDGMVAWKTIFFDKQWATSMLLRRSVGMVDYRLPIRRNTSTRVKPQDMRL